MLEKVSEVSIPGLTCYVEPCRKGAAILRQFEVVLHSGWQSEVRLWSMFSTIPTVNSPFLLQIVCRLCAMSDEIAITLSYEIKVEGASIRPFIDKQYISQLFGYGL